MSVTSALMRSLAICGIAGVRMPTSKANRAFEYQPKLLFMTDLLLVSTATPDRDSALALAQTLVGRKLAGSAQVMAATCVFWHLGEMGTGEEWRIELATTVDRYPVLERELLAAHPWDNPQLTAVPIARSSEAYARWARESTLSSCS